MRIDIIETNAEKLRDPFVLAENGTYYMYGTQVTSDWDYGTDWACYKNISGRLDGEWVKVENVANIPGDAIKNRWARRCINIMVHIICLLHIIRLKQTIEAVIY